MRFRLPKAFMQSADILAAPAWTDTGLDLIVDIQPTGTIPGVDPSSRPMQPSGPFSHVGFVDGGDLGPLDVETPSKHRLRQGMRQFEILRINDWDGFYRLDLEEVRGG